MADFPVSANVRPAINDIDKLIASLRAAGKQAGLTEDEIQKVVTTAQKAGTEGAGGINKINSELGNLGGIAKTVGPALAGVFALDKLKDFVGQVVNITAEFQKFEAVLTNTLGSNSAARKALADITKFATLTPFSVRELTDSFVKLANQGFKPTQAELRKLGDLAASTGKDFNQLTEAIIDAQTGEFERLKEFGIRASKSGDQVKFTFKEVETQTNFTAKSIREYLLSLGDLEGVSGSMVAVSKTLGGQINNLADSWDKFLSTLGDGNSGALSGTVSLLDRALKIATDLVTTNSQRREQEQTAVYSEQYDAAKKIYETTKDINKAREESIRIIHEELRTIDSAMQGIDSQIAKYETNQNAGLFKKRTATPQEQQAYLANLQERNRLVNRYNDLVNDGQKGVLEFVKEAQKEEERINLEKQKGLQLTSKQIDAENERLQKLRDFREQVALENQDFINKTASEGTKGLKNFAGQGDPALNESLNIDTSETSDTKVKSQDDLRNERDQRNTLRQAEFDFAVNLINTLSTIQNEADQMERDRLRSKYEYDLRLAGNNETAKAKIKAEFDKKDRELQQRQAQRARDMAVFDIFLNTGRGIMAALTSVPPNVPLSIFIGATGLLQAGLALSRPLPKFKDGVFDLIGPGTETSDSILARLSAHETVVPARKSRKFKDILKPIVEDENITYNDLKGIIDKNIPNAVRGDLFFKLKQESDPVMHEVRDILRDIKNKPTSHVNIDKHGFFEYQEKELHRKKVYKDKISW